MKTRSLAALCIALAVLALHAAPAGARERVDEVAAGSLRARSTGDPWRLVFLDRSGAAILRVLPRAGLRFLGADGWVRATRVLQRRRTRRAHLATLATDDPLGRRLALRIEPDAEGVIALRVEVTGRTAGQATRLGIGFRARGAERYLGFGERSNAVNQRGREVESYVAEGAFEPDERALVPLFVPNWGFRPRDDATYFPMPWLLSTAGYGVLVDNPQTSRFDLGADSPRAWSVDVDGRVLRLRVFAGPRPAAVLRRLSERIGRQPRPPAPFVFGPWYQPRDDEAKILRRLRRGNVPLSVAQTYTHYLPCEDQRGREPAERERVRRLHAAGLAVTTYFNPMICTDHSRYAEAAARGGLVRNASGEPYVYRYSTRESFEVAQFDFTSRAGRGLYERLVGEAIGHGHDGWMEDFGEYTPPDARASHGSTGSALHNLYPRQYHCAAQAAAPRALRFVRSGWTGSARCSPVVWGGDPTVGWGFDGLRSAVTNGLTMGLSGVSTWGSDIGGFFALLGNRLTPELLVRWIQLGAVSGVMRTQANGIRIPDSPRPQVWDERIAGHWRRWAELRTQLYPYLSAADGRYRRSGLPIMSHLALAFPGDRRAVAQDTTFMFGPDLLAAPVVNEGARRRSLYLPRGRWIDVWRSARYLERGGGLALGPARMLSGGRRIELPAPLGELPLLARAGTLLALLTPDVDTLARYGNRAGVTSLSERRGRRVLLAWPRGRSAARLEAGGMARSRATRRAWALSLRSRRRTRWAIEASLGALRRPFRPCSVEADGGRLASWRYDGRARVLRMRFTARRGRVVARGC